MYRIHESILPEFTEMAVMVMSFLHNYGATIGLQCEDHEIANRNVGKVIINR